MKLTGGIVRRTRHLMALLGTIMFMFAFAPGLTPTHMQGSPDGNLTTLNGGAYFTGLSFSNSSGGPDTSYFPVGTQQIFARWNFANVPPGAGITLLRQWYLNGKLSIQKEESWNPAWGVSGRLSHISIYDFKEGLTPGYYHVVISLMYDYPAAQVAGDFVIADYPAPVNPPSNGSSFSNLTVSSSAAGPDTAVFPNGTQIISARWDYANIPLGVTVQRDWYINGVLFRSVREPWSAYWGTTGRLTHIAIYDYERGLPAGNYRLNVYLPEIAGVQATVNFSIGGFQNGPAQFNNLTFSNSANGPASGIFAHGTPQIFARWDYNSVAPGATVLRRWYRNGALWLQRQEPWLNGTSGTVQNISIYDFRDGLLPGDYYMEISLIGYPNSMIRGYFTIQ